MKKILLPTDFSENAQNAISYALLLYKEVECEFYILHTYTPISVSTGGMMGSYSTLALQEQEKEITEQKLKVTKDKLKNEYNNANHTFVTMASFNYLVSQMKEVIREKDIDAVVMGTKGASGLGEVFVGTNTMRTIKNIKIPVIAVPSGFKYEKPKEVLLPTDYKFSKSNRYLLVIKELCEAHSSRLHILNIYNDIALDEEQKKTKSFLEHFFKNTISFFHSLKRSEIIEAIEVFETKHKVNFLIMIHNKHHFFDELFFKQVVTQMVYHTNVPFLVIPSEDQINS